MVTAPNRSSIECADDLQPLLGQPVAGVGPVGLADRAQHVLAQRRGVADAGEAGADIGGQRRGQARTAGPPRRRSWR